MDYSEIRQLMQKYWEAETTSEEEALLRQFFAQPPASLPDDLKDASLLFDFWAEEAERKMPEDPAWEEDPGNHPHQGATGTRTIRMVRMWKYAAAVVILMIGVFAFWQIRHARSLKTARTAFYTDTYQDPEKAYEATRKVLMMMADNLNMGKQEMQKLSKYNEAEEIIRKTVPGATRKIQQDHK